LNLVFEISPASARASTPQPTPQYGQVVRQLAAAGAFIA